MNYEWYKLFSATEFEATGLVARTLTEDLEDRGEQSFYITKGNLLSVTYEGEFLPVNFFDQNPYEQAGYAIYKDADENVWFGFGVEE